MPVKLKATASKLLPPAKVDPTECPFREFRDNELSTEYWGLSAAAMRQMILTPKVTGKQAASHQSTAGHQASAGQPLQVVWNDDQAQPLPRSVRHILDGWVRAEDLAMERFESEVVVCEETTSAMSVIDFQLSHAQVLLRSSFCRDVLSCCYILEKVEGLPVEHMWDNFNFSFGPEGWRAKYHIYSPGMKPGGGVQHRPMLSKNGCYMVRLYYLGAWRCVWVSDLVPVDTSGAPLLPFSPLSSPSPIKQKGMPAMVISPYVHLWPLLLCKALLKLAAPDMAINFEENPESEFVDDEDLSDFSIMHALTGGFSYNCLFGGYDDVWDLLCKEVKIFTWDDDDDYASTIRSKSIKKAPPKEKEKESSSKKVGVSVTGGLSLFLLSGSSSVVKAYIAFSRLPSTAYHPRAPVPTLGVHHQSKKGDGIVSGRRGSFVSIVIEDTKMYPVYALPGITPGHEMSLIVTMVRDVPIKRPLPEPEVAQWKHFRWVDWARRHGLYEDYECPRTKFLKVNGLMKLSYAPHLLDVTSTESLTHVFREEHKDDKKKPTKDAAKVSQSAEALQKRKEELREWVKFDIIQPLVKNINFIFYPSMFEFTSAASNPPFRITKSPLKGIDLLAPTSAPLYLQIDGPEKNQLKISLSMLHPRILANCGFPVEDFIERSYIVLESFEWFKDTPLPIAKAFITTRSYDSVEIEFLPGRHYCRLWVHSRMNWHAALLSESSLLLGTRDTILVASTQQCEWAEKFLNYLSVAFTNWIRSSRSFTTLAITDREFFEAYEPDLRWDTDLIGYDRHFIHWMFRQALQQHLFKRMQPADYYSVCVVLRRHFMDPDFGFPPKPKAPKSVREIMERDPCDCVLPEGEGGEEEENICQPEEQEKQEGEEKSPEPLLSAGTMAVLLSEPKGNAKSAVCELATEELPCGVLKREREKEIQRHEAATFIQAFWRGYFARKCLTTPVPITQETIKILMENAFGNLEVLSALMNQFFLMFPGTKYAYSVSSALSGVYGLNQYTGATPALTVCKWIPYFQGVFYCHYPVKVHFDIRSAMIEHSTVKVYDNDNGMQLPQAYNAHITFDIEPNVYGYTVLGHGSLNQPLGYSADIPWQLTVLTSMDHVFHVCDNFVEGCNIQTLTPASKLHIDEMYKPNRRNILGGIKISVTRVEAVSFRAATTSPNMPITAILRTASAVDGQMEEVARCHGDGEIFWPYIRLKPFDSLDNMKKTFQSTGNLRGQSQVFNASNKNLSKGGKTAKGARPVIRSATKLHPSRSKAPSEPKTYTIDVIAPESWALSINQWRRIQEITADIGIPKIETPVTPKGKKDAGKEKAGGGSAKDKKKDDDKILEKPAFFVVHQPQPGDAYTEIECSTAVGGGVLAQRDDDRDILFANTLRAWEIKEPGRNARGAIIREQFRDEYLVPPPQPPRQDDTVSVELGFNEHEIIGEAETKSLATPTLQGPSPATESGLLEIEMEEESLYYATPEALKDKFVPLYFVPLCTKEKTDDECVIMTADMNEAGKLERAARLEAALVRMRMLQTFNEVHVLARQKRRIRLLEKQNIDHNWCPELEETMDTREEAIAQEALERQLSAARKKQEAKTQTSAKQDAKKRK